MFLSVIFFEIPHSRLGYKKRSGRARREVMLLWCRFCAHSAIHPTMGREMWLVALRLYHLWNEAWAMLFGSLQLMWKQNFLNIDLYLLNLLQLVKIAEYSNKDAAIRSAKILPSAEDKRFIPKLFDNPCTASIFENEGLQYILKDRKTYAYV